MKKSKVKRQKANKKIGFFSLFTFTFLLLTLLTDPPATAGGTDLFAQSLTVRLNAEVLVAWRAGALLCLLADAGCV
ncbi:MAG: hypothetical protein AUG51_00325 [Acidobacteria bacterium 13_1_20CM_3_53_8]|nr:MAG: hypothetical protein AUG51_00325 [Acidobacteria bacterium 13_1_20CM_3_53_8]